MKIRLVLFGIFIAGLLTSCGDDFLDRPSLSDVSSEAFYTTTEELRLATAALYAGSPWAEWTYECYLPVGEVLSGNMAVGYWDDAVQLHTFSVNELNQIMIKNWKGMYKIIGHCNMTIEAIKKSPSTIPQADRNAALAEAKFIRGFAYYNLALLWGDVPIIEDNVKITKSPLVYLNPVVDVYRFVINDLMFATRYLPRTDVKGRLTTWSAQGMLSKVYLTLAGLNHAGQRDQVLLDSAKLFAGNVCKNSGLSLLQNYADLFKTANNDNRESLFALQWVAGREWLEGNMLQIYSSGGREIAAGGPGWFSIRPTVDIYNRYTIKDSTRRKATFMLKGDYYPELNAAGGGFKFAGESGLKKHIVGTRADNNAPTMTNTSSTEHNSLLRLAEVYLIYAEAILGNNATTDDVDALDFFNQVRTRAGLDPLSSITPDTLRHERRIELAAEGHFWNDLVRLSYYDPEKAIGILNKQQRVPFKYSNGVATPENPFGIITPANKGTFKFPIPLVEITANPNLLKDPVPYSF
jgi:starch-binding outer membrane protein, SusD/RagB family